MHKLCVSALSAVMLASPLAALAQSPDPTGTQTLSSFDDRWYLLPFGTYTWADEDRGIDDGCGWGFAVGKPVNEWLNLELRATYTSLAERPAISVYPPSRPGVRPAIPEGLPQGDFTIGDIGIDGVFVFNRRGTVQPFLLAGLGAINDDFDCDRIPANRGICNSDSAWSFMAEAGAGVMFRVAEYASVRLDGRYRYDDNSGGLRRDDSFGDWIATAGLVIPIGGRAAPVKTTRAYELSADALFAFNKSNLSSQGVTTVNNLASDLSQGVLRCRPRGRAYGSDRIGRFQPGTVRAPRRYGAGSTGHPRRPGRPHQCNGLWRVTAQGDTGGLRQRQEQGRADRMLPAQPAGRGDGRGHHPETIAGTDDKPRAMQGRMRTGAMEPHPYPDPRLG